MLRLTSLACCVALSFTASTLHAQDGTDEERAEAHFRSGRAYYERARYEEAAREFLESYRLSPRPELLENAARAYERGLLFDEAIATLQQILTAHAGFESEATVRERIENLERLRDRMQAGGEAETSGGAETRTEITPPPAVSAPPSSGGGVSIPGILVLSGGGALGIAAIITGAVSHASFEALMDECGPDRVCAPERQGDIDTGNALAITSTVLTFVSIAALAAGIVLLVVDTGGGGEQAELELTPNGLMVRGTF